MSLTSWHDAWETLPESERSSFLPSLFAAQDPLRARFSALLGLPPAEASPEAARQVLEKKALRWHALDAGHRWELLAEFHRRRRPEVVAAFALATGWSGEAVPSGEGEAWGATARSLLRRLLAREEGQKAWKALRARLSPSELAGQAADWARCAALGAALPRRAPSGAAERIFHLASALRSLAGKERPFRTLWPASQGTAGLHRRVRQAQAAVARKTAEEALLPVERKFGPPRPEEAGFALVDVEVNGGRETAREIRELAVWPRGSAPREWVFSPLRGAEGASGRREATDPEKLRTALAEARRWAQVGHNVLFDQDVMESNAAWIEGLATPEAYRERFAALYENYEILHRPPSAGWPGGAADTLDLAYLLLPHAGGHRLADLARRLPEPCRQAHRALDDVQLLQRVLDGVLLPAARQASARRLLGLLPDSYALKRFLGPDIPGGLPALGGSEADVASRVKSLLQEAAPYPSVASEGGGSPVSLDGVRVGAEDCAGHRVFAAGRERPAPGAPGRPGAQWEILRAVGEHLQEGRPLLLEAGTGTGKTLGYLLPIVRLLQSRPGTKYVVSTHTKLLQAQVSATLREIDAAGDGPPVGQVVVKGKENYYCPWRLARFLGRLAEILAKDGQGKNWRLAALAVYAVQVLARHVFPPEGGEPWDGCLEDMPYHVTSQFDPLGTGRKAVCFSRSESPCAGCGFPAAGLCPVRAKQQAVSDPGRRVIIVNHALALAGERSGPVMAAAAGETAGQNSEPAGFPGAIRRQASAVLFDEGHHVEAVYRDANSLGTDQADSEGRLFLLEKRLLPSVRAAFRHPDTPPALREALGRAETALREYAERVKAFEEVLNRAMRSLAASRDEAAAGPLGAACRLGGDAHSWCSFIQPLLFGPHALCRVAPAPEFDGEKVGRLREQVSRWERFLLLRGADSHVMSPEATREVTRELAELQNLFRCPESYHRETEASPLAFLDALRDLLPSPRPGREKAEPPTAEDLGDEVRAALEQLSARMDELAAVLDGARILRIHFRQFLAGFAESALARLTDPETGFGTMLDIRNGAASGDAWNRLMAGILLFDGAARMTLRDPFNTDEEFAVYLELLGSPVRCGESLDGDADGAAAGEQAPSGVERDGSARAGLAGSGAYNWRAKQFPVDVAGAAGNFLGAFERVALVSATLLVEPGQEKNQRENHFVRRLGLAALKPEVKRVPSPFDPGESVRVFVPEQVSAPEDYLREDHLLDLVVEAVRWVRLTRHMDGIPGGARGLVLCTSRLQLQVLRLLLEECPEAREGGMQLLFQGALSREELKRRFVDGSCRVLFGMASYGEGFDVLDDFWAGRAPGAAGRVNPVRWVGLAKIPFPNPADPVHEAILETLGWRDRLTVIYQRYRLDRCEDNLEARARIRAEGRPDSAFESYLLPLTRIAFTQWTGRLLRTGRDRGLLAVFDPRLLTRQWAVPLLAPLGRPGASAPELGNVFPYGSDLVDAENRYRGESLDLARIAARAGRRLDDWAPLPFRGKPVFGEVAANAPPGFWTDPAAAATAGDVRGGDDLPQRLLTFSGEYASHDEAGVTLQQLQHRPLFRLVDLVWHKGRRRPQKRKLFQVLDRWSVARQEPSWFRQVAESLARAKRPAKVVCLGPQKEWQRLERLTAEYRRVRGLFLAGGGAVSAEQDADNLRRLVESVNKGFRALVSVTGDRLRVVSQYEVVDRVRNARHDRFHVLPTSFGKSLCFQAPALLGEGLTVIFTPTQALADRQLRDLRDQLPEVVPGVDALSGVTGSRKELGRRLEAGDRRLRLLYINPKQLQDPVLFQQLLNYPHWERFVFDESHLLGTWGRSALMHQYGLAFSLLRGVRARAMAGCAHGEGRKAPAVFGFTATEREEAFRDLRARYAFDLPAARCWRSAVNRPDIDFEVEDIDAAGAGGGAFDAKLAALRRVVRETEPGKGNRLFVFCCFAGLGARPGVEQVASFLRQDPDLAPWHGQVFAYHSGRRMNPAQLAGASREKAVLVSTEALGMGIDLQGVRTVVHFDLPRSPELFVQYMGRARSADPLEEVAGKRRRNVTFFSLREVQHELSLLNKEVKEPPRLDPFNSDNTQNWGGSFLKLSPPLAVTGKLKRKYFVHNLQVLVSRAGEWAAVPTDDAFRRILFAGSLFTLRSPAVDLHLWAMAEKRPRGFEILYPMRSGGSRVNIGRWREARQLLERRFGSWDGAREAFSRLLAGRADVLAAAASGPLPTGRPLWNQAWTGVNRLALRFLTDGYAVPTLDELVIGRVQGEKDLDPDYPARSVLPLGAEKGAGLAVADVLLFCFWGGLATWVDGAAVLVAGLRPAGLGGPSGTFHRMCRRLPQSADLKEPLNRALLDAADGIPDPREAHRRRTREALQRILGIVADPDGRPRTPGEIRARLVAYFNPEEARVLEPEKRNGR